jgi:hypothetical protein
MYLVLAIFASSSDAAAYPSKSAAISLFKKKIINMAELIDTLGSQLKIKGINRTWHIINITCGNDEVF